MSDLFKKSAEMGVGIGLRRPHYGEIIELAAKPAGTLPAEIGWLELIAENFMGFGGRPRAVARQAAQRWPVVCHGVGLNLGALDPIPVEYLSILKTLVQELDSPWFSDHLCFSASSGNTFHDLIPVPRTAESVDNIVRRIQTARDAVGVPIAVENVSMYVDGPHWEFDEPEFLSQIVHRSDCLLLLDINNIYVNCMNHGWSTEEYLCRVPLERVIQVHLAGHWNRGDLRIDTHGEAVCEPVWDLYRSFLKKLGRPVATLIEWDNEIPPLNDLLQEAQRARSIVSEVF